MKKKLVFQSDFGLMDGAVAAMYGVALQIDRDLLIYDLTHDIEPYNVWEASYRLFQTVEYWEEGTVFVSVVDPGVGSNRKSIVALTNGGHFIVTPNNGTLTHIKRYVGIKEVYCIDEEVHMRKNTLFSYTFHGRDLFSNTGAKIAAEIISLSEVGDKIENDDVVELEVGEVVKTKASIKGSIDILDVRFGSLWTNITRDDFVNLGISYGDKVEIVIRNGSTLIYNNRVSFGKSFADVYVGEQIVYVNSLYRMAVAINQGNFAKAYAIGTGIHWSIEFKRV